MKVIRDPELRARTTLHTGGRARAEVLIDGAPDLEQLEEVLTTLGGRPFILGQGSNLLVMEGALPLVLIRLMPARTLELSGEDEKRITARVGGGESLAWLLGCLQKLGVSGLEPLAGIPGSVGGAVAMNAGSYGACIADFLTRVQVYTPGQGPRWLSPGQWEAGYRRFEIPGVHDQWWVVTAVELSLVKSDPELIRQNLRRAYLRKKDNQPILAKTCGCVFKNPPGNRSAWQLLDECGFRGRRVGDMAFSDQHCNFLVNTGGGTGTQGLELIDMAREKVKRMFGVVLELEVRVVQ